MEEPYDAATLVMDMQVRRDASRNAAIVSLSPIEKEWDQDGNRERNEARDTFRRAYGKQIQLEDRPGDKGYDLPIPAPSGMDLDAHFQNVVRITQAFAQARQFILDTGEEQPSQEDTFVAKAKRKRERKQAWQGLEKNVDTIVKDEDLTADERTAQIMKSFRAFVQQRRSGHGRGGEES